MGLVKKAGIFFGIGLAIYVLAVVLSWFLYPWSGEVSVKIKQLTREKHVSRVDFAEISNFPWTDMYAFGPYGMREDICSVLGLTGFACWWVAPEMVDEGHYFLVFRNKQEIVHREHHARYHGDLSAAGQPQPLRREDATFLVTQEGKATSGGEWLFLKHKSSSRRSDER